MTDRSRARLVLAFAIIYVVWGSTYLAIRWTVETLPPFFTSGVRFLLAGTALFLLGRWRGASRPTPVQWRSAALLGFLFLTIGNGAVAWAEQRLNSSLAALLITTEPLWIVLLDWWRRGGVRPSWTVGLGVVLGFAGVCLLIDPTRAFSGAGIHLPSALAIICGSFTWAVGSLLVARRGVDVPASPLLATGMQMLMGGAIMLAVGLARGELAGFDSATVSARSLGAFGYLVVFGAIVGFTAYTYLLKHASPTAASTYAYINPLTAVVLGWALGRERLAAHTLVASAVVIGAVILVLTSRTRALAAGVATVRRRVTGSFSSEAT